MANDQVVVSGRGGAIVSGVDFFVRSVHTYPQNLDEYASTVWNFFERRFRRFS
jgi:hypothetical protein